MKLVPPRFAAVINSRYTDKMQFRTGANIAKCTDTARTNCEDSRWSLEIGNNSWSTLNSNLLKNWQWIHATKSKIFGNVASPMAMQWQCKVNGVCKLKSCYLYLSFTWLTVLRLSCSLHANPMCPWLGCEFERPKVLKFGEGCVHTSILTNFEFVYRIVALEYWCLGVFLSNGVFDKLIQAVSVWRRLAQKKCAVIMVIRYTIIHFKKNKLRIKT